MSCFCIGNIDLLAKLKADLQLDASMALSAHAEAALALHARLSAGLPGLPGPPFALPDIGLSAGAWASLTAVAQLRAQAKDSLGIDLDAEAGLKAVARLAATLNARLSAVASLGFNAEAWIRLSTLNDIALALTATFKACLAASAQAEASASAAFDFVMPPLSWGGPQLVSASVLARLAAQLGARLDAAFVASLRATARLVARATAHVELDVAAVARLTAAFSAVAKLRATLGIDPVHAGFPAVRAAVAANYAVMVSYARKLDVDLSAGARGLPAPGSIPGLRAALLASLTARLQAAASGSAEFSAGAWASAGLDASASAAVDLSLSAIVAASLSVSLSAALGMDVALRAPCGVCDLPAVMAALPTQLPVPGGTPAVPGLPAANLPTGPGVPASRLPAGPVAPSPAAGGGAGSGGTGDAATGESGYSGGGGTSGGGGSSDSWDDGGSSGGGGGTGGGGVPAVVATAQMMCTFGTAPSGLTVLPVNRTQVGKQFAANIMDHVPMANILPFGMCMSLANPVVASATAAALGVLTPMPCIPATSAPWVPGAPTVMLGNQPMLDANCKCMCMWAGVISIVSPGQVQTVIP